MSLPDKLLRNGSALKIHGNKEIKYILLLREGPSAGIRYTVPSPCIEFRWESPLMQIPKQSNAHSNQELSQESHTPVSLFQQFGEIKDLH